MGKPKQNFSVNLLELRPYLVYPDAVAWKILPTKLKRQIKTAEQLSFYKRMFGPQKPVEDEERLDAV